MDTSRERGWVREGQVDTSRGKGWVREGQVDTSRGKGWVREGQVDTSRGRGWVRNGKIWSHTHKPLTQSLAVLCSKTHTMICGNKPVN